MTGRVSVAAGSVTVVTINAPERRNAISTQMRDDLVAALDSAFGDQGCRSIVLTGAGNHFCAGFDVTAMADGGSATADDLRDRLERLHVIVRKIATGPKPVVAAVEGMAAGAGLSFALACDFVVAGPGACFVASWGRLALAADCGALWLLPQRVGYGHARDLLFSARRVERDEALRIGLADEGAGAGEVLAAAMARAQGYAATAPGAIARTKAALVQSWASTFQEALEAEIDIQRDLKLSPEHEEARRAFLEKRQPRFGCREAQG